jgi:hypothetical protein
MGYAEIKLELVEIKLEQQEVYIDVNILVEWDDDDYAFEIESIEHEGTDGEDETLLTLSSCFLSREFLAIIRSELDTNWTETIDRKVQAERDLDEDYVLRMRKLEEMDSYV